MKAKDIRPAHRILGPGMKWVTVRTVDNVDGFIEVVPVVGEPFFLHGSVEVQRLNPECGGSCRPADKAPAEWGIR